MTYTKLLTQKNTSHKIVIQGKSMNIQHVIDLLNRAELYEESSAVLAMVEQNKDMLEALKAAKDALEHMWREVSMNEYDYEKLNEAIINSDSAITKAEEAE